MYYNSEGFRFFYWCPFTGFVQAPLLMRQPPQHVSSPRGWEHLVETVAVGPYSSSRCRGVKLVLGRGIKDTLLVSIVTTHCPDPMDITLSQVIFAL